MSSPTDFKSFLAAGVIAGYRFVAYTANYNEVAQASSNADKLAGISDMVGSSAAGAMVDVAQGDWHEVQLGGTVAAGDYLTSDANGCAIKAVKVALTDVRVGARAQMAGVSGDVIRVVIADFVISG